MNRNPLQVCLFALAAVFAWIQYAGAANAETVIYKSTDAKGHVSYGDAPLSSAITVEEIRLPTAPPPTDAAEIQTRLEKVIATSNRLHSDRIERENRRAAETESTESAASTASATASPEFYPQYRINHGPLFLPSPFRERQWWYPRTAHAWDDGYPPRHLPPGGLGSRPPHRSSVLRNPPGR